MPQPKDNEKQGDYMGRCMDFLSKEERTDRPQKQKVAICLNTFNAPKKKSKGTNVEIDFTEQIKEMKDKKAKEEAEKQAKSEPAIQPVVEQKIEAPAPVVVEQKVEPVSEVKVETPVVEPTHNAVTAPAEQVSEVKVEENKVS